MLRNVVFNDCLAKVVAQAPLLCDDVFTKALMDNTAESCLLLPRNQSASVRLGYTRHGSEKHLLLCDEKSTATRNLHCGAVGSCVFHAVCSDAKNMFYVATSF